MNNDPNNETFGIRVKWDRRKWLEVRGQPAFSHPATMFAMPYHRLRRKNNLLFSKHRVSLIDHRWARLFHPLLRAVPSMSHLQDTTKTWLLPTLVFTAECLGPLEAFAETIVILHVHGHEDGIDVLLLGEPVPMGTGAICYEGV